MLRLSVNPLACFSLLFISGMALAMEADDLEAGPSASPVEIFFTPLPKQPVASKEINLLSIRILRALTGGAIDAPAPVSPMPVRAVCDEGDIDLESGGMSLPMLTAAN